MNGIREKVCFFQYTHKSHTQLLGIYIEMPRTIDGMYQGRFFLLIVTAIVPFLVVVMVVGQGRIPRTSRFGVASGCGLSLASSLQYLFVSFPSTAQGKVDRLGLSWSLMFGMHVPPRGCGTRDMIQDQDMTSSGEGRKDEHPPHASQGMQMLQQETM